MHGVYWTGEGRVWQVWEKRVQMSVRQGWARSARLVVTREDNLPESLTRVHSGAKEEQGVVYFRKGVSRLSWTSGLLLAQLGDTAI